MLKVLFVSSQLIGLLFLNMFYAPREVKLSHDLPSSSIIGSEHWVYVNIDKNKLGGFAKLQVDVPQGMQVEPGDLRGASFTFAEGAAKIIWMSLPPENEFEISYKLIIYDDCQVGNNVIKQKFAYLEKNERKILEIPNHVIYIDSENLSNEYVPDTLANGTRTITKLSDDHYLIELDLYKDGIKGFAKVEEYIPAGMNAEAVNKAKSVFTQIDNKVKFVWFSIPEEERLKLTYELIADGPIDENLLIEGESPISGEFTYLRNNESRSISLGTNTDAPIADYIGEYPDPEVDTPEVDITEPVVDIDTPEVDVTNPVVDVTNPVVDIDAPEVDIDTPEVDVTNPVVDVTNPVVDIDAPEVDIDTPEVDVTNPVVDVTNPIVDVDAPEVDVTEPISENVTAVAETTDVAVNQEIDNLGQVTDFPSPDKGVSYRVQIMAGKNLVDAVYLKKRHKWIDTFTIENHETWIKYTTGTFSFYKEARDKRNHITDNYNFDGPFVTAYNEGTRITVQEALMITRQKWYQ